MHKLCYYYGVVGCVLWVVNLRRVKPTPSGVCQRLEVRGLKRARGSTLSPPAATHVSAFKYCTTVSDFFEKFKSKYRIVLYCEFLEIEFKF